ncbi:TPA: hypothetical protein DEG21_04060 [Patescibacteria group bacterium]|nr:hypothetical protein [Candidatus Gracilibacteria bacterium]
MSDKVQLIDLVNKNYTGDALGFEKEISLSQISPVSKIDEDLSPQKIEAPELPKKEEITLDLSKKLTREEAGEIKQ